ncbi:MAG: aldo/keto reductase [Candidatus Hydrogenedentes bacterium]|nr:aldo/keto reductase [Candidatus Hydrogenedentota bacterium]
MLPLVRFGKTELRVSRLALGGFPLGGVNRARGWDPFTGDGRKAAIGAVHAALDAGINYIDTAPSYGNGNSESVIGEALAGRRDSVVVATKVGHREMTKESVRESVASSLQRLRTDWIDVIQFHGGAYTLEDVRVILDDGLLEALRELRAEGKVRFLGFTTEEPWTALPLIVSGQFDVLQIRYNLIYQGAALHALDAASKADLGVIVMRPMTSGIFQRMAQFLAPRWQEAHDLYEVSLKFVLADSRVHVANVGMRWPEEIARNVALVNSFVPPFDMAKLPRFTAEIYRTEDEELPH